MSGAVEIDNKNLLPIKEVIGLFSYSRDYITRLAREGKIDAAKIGRKWYINPVSLQSYQEQAELEAEIRKRHLSEERKREREVREQVEQNQSAHDIRVRTTHAQAVLTACLVATVGVLSGFAAHLLLTNASVTQLAGGGFVVKSSVVTELPAESLTSPASTAYNVTPSLPADASLVSQATSSSVSLGDAVAGIVLFPGGMSASATALFSDPVQVVVASSTAYVQRQNEVGHGVGRAIPFIQVPVVTESSL